jgi:predicted kinase
VLWALARSQLRLGASVVLDGVARDPEVQGTRQVAAEEGAACVVVMASCADAGLHRSRVEGRQRQIPGWYELDWDHVERARSSWVAPDGLDLVLDAGEPMEANAAAIRALLAEQS